jgi:hypothetical protein
VTAWFMLIDQCVTETTLMNPVEQENKATEAPQETVPSETAKENETLANTEKLPGEAEQAATSENEVVTSTSDKPQEQKPANSTEHSNLDTVPTSTENVEVNTNTTKPATSDGPNDSEQVVVDKRGEETSTDIAVNKIVEEPSERPQPSKEPIELS